MEERIRHLEGVTDASIDFASGKLTLEVQNKNHIERILKQSSEIIRQIESHVEIVHEKRKDESEEVEEPKIKKELVNLAVGGVFFLVPTVFVLNFWVEFTLYFISYFIVGREVLIKSFKNILRGEVFDENFLMSLATIGAFAVKQFPEGVAVMLFYQIGELFQDIAVNKSRKSISGLMDIRPDYANIKEGNDMPARGGRGRRRFRAGRRDYAS
jgi:Cd2+/Zn2+-exporting ATPase